ncbi:MAG: glutathione S-transferase N-terminal domain-containing protein, partial [Rhabdochlamydiaceae bacterium]|nr:glutathione S-transferase N-terminal domain-containing protein [Candidatus Amphrikana amoebophyrae]
MALCFANIQFELREFSVKEKPAEFLEISPDGTVPLLVLPNGDIISESIDIVKWALPNENFSLQTKLSEQMLPTLRSLLYDKKPCHDQLKPLLLELMKVSSSVATKVIFFRHVKKLIHEYRDWMIDHFPSITSWLKEIEQDTRFEFALNRYKVGCQLLINPYTPKIRQRIIEKLQILEPES